jgi:hypothetical protein
MVKAPPIAMHDGIITLVNDTLLVIEILPSTRATFMFNVVINGFVYTRKLHVRVSHESDIKTFRC